MAPGIELSRNRSITNGFHSARSVRAFTLFEVLVVLGLLVLLVGISWPVLQNQITGAQLPESADRIRDMFFMVRAEAAMEHRRFRIRFAPEEQQPYIEYEPDPIREPGQWQPVEAAWARKPILLADIQVHEIRPGRPEFLKPVSIYEDSDESEQEEFAEEGLEADEFDDTEAESVMDEEDAAIDENRPLIIFEADGSTEWAMLILATKPLADVLEEEDPQLWVVLDGRTGLAHVREKVTEEQLNDPDFYYAQREKLELPDVLNPDELVFQSGGSGTGTGSTGSATNGTAGTGTGTGTNTGTGGESGTEVPRDGGEGTDLTDLSGGSNLSDEVGGGGRRGNRGDSGDSSDPDKQAEEADLSEEELENIRRTLGGRG